MRAARLICAALLGLLGWWAGGCEPERPATDAAAWRLVDLAPVPAGGRSLVSPRFSDAGQLRALRRGGRGRVLLDPQVAGIQDLPGTWLEPAAWDDGFAVLFDDGRRSVRWAPYWGEVQVVAGGRTTVLERQDAWGVVVSPHGGRVAWCTGHLPEARLRVATAEGRGLYTGPGAQPAWHPDGLRLVFVRPRSAPDAAGQPGLVGAAVGLLDTDSGRVTGLATPGVALPMQPAIAPDGTGLALADWATGRLLLGRLGGGQ